MLPKVLAGCLIGAFVTLLLPRETIARWVGAESGIAGILVATVAGAILPGGPFTIYPVAGAFLAAGADAGAACAFVISLDADRLHPRDRVGAAVLRPRLRDLAHHLLAAAADPRGPCGARDRGASCKRKAARMNLIIDIALWTIVVALGLTLFLRSQPMFADSLRFARREFLALLPRIAIGMIGSGFIAEILPKQLIPSLARAGHRHRRACSSRRSRAR